MCGRYSIFCGISLIQIDSDEAARCSSSVSFLTELDYCVVFVDQVGIFLEYMLRILKASKDFMPDTLSFLFMLLAFLLL